MQRHKAVWKSLLRWPACPLLATALLSAVIVAGGDLIIRIARSSEWLDGSLSSSSSNSLADCKAERWGRHGPMVFPYSIVSFLHLAFNCFKLQVNSLVFVMYRLLRSDVVKTPYLFESYPNLKWNWLQKHGAEFVKCKLDSMRHISTCDEFIPHSLRPETSTLSMIGYASDTLSSILARKNSPPEQKKMPNRLSWYHRVNLEWSVHEWFHVFEYR